MHIVNTSSLRRNFLDPSCGANRRRPLNPTARSVCELLHSVELTTSAWMMFIVYRSRDRSVELDICAIAAMPKSGRTTCTEIGRYPCAGRLAGPFCLRKQWQIQLVREFVD